MGKARPKTYGTRRGTGAPLCRHCGKRPASRPRGLCWRDYYTSGVRERYPVKDVGAETKARAEEAILTAQARRFPPAYREAHRQRMLAEQRRVQEELARLGEGQ